MTKAEGLGWWEELMRWEKIPGKKRMTILYGKRILREPGRDWTHVEMVTGDREVWRKIGRGRQTTWIGGIGIEAEMGKIKSPK